MTFDPARLRRQLVLHEGFARVPYVDTEGNVTGGIGHNFAAHPFSDEDIERWYEDDVTMAIISLDASLPWWRDLDEVRQRVMIDMTFNMGMGTPGKSGLLSFVSTLAMIKAGEYGSAAVGMENSKWARQTKGRATRLIAMMREGRDV